MIHYFILFFMIWGLSFQNMKRCLTLCFCHSSETRVKSSSQRGPGDGAVGLVGSLCITAASVICQRVCFECQDLCKPPTGVKEVMKCLRSDFSVVEFSGEMTLWKAAAGPGLVLTRANALKKFLFWNSETSQYLPDSRLIIPGKYKLCCHRLVYETFLF